MSWMTTVGAAGLLVLAASTATAQSGVGLTTTAPDRQELQTRTPPNADLRSSPARPFVGEPPLHETPMFIGPTLRTETSELGFAMWIAPNTQIGGARTGRDEVNGWASFGLTYTWGGRPSGGRAIR